MNTFIFKNRQNQQWDRNDHSMNVTYFEQVVLLSDSYVIVIQWFVRLNVEIRGLSHTLVTYHGKFYTTYNTVDLVHYEIICVKAGKD